MGKGDLKTKRGKRSNGSYGVKRKRKKHSYKIFLNHCIYCGTILIKKKAALKIEEKTGNYPDRGKTKDHVPQKCLYEGYSENYKKNRFTVPSCYKCNQEFSKVENELRDLIGVANENNDNQKEITKDAVKSIKKKPNYEKRLKKDNKGIVRGVEFNLDTLLPSHIKNFKGVFYKTYDKHFPNNFTIRVLDTKQPTNIDTLANEFLENNVEWEISGHKDIFKFKIALIKPNDTGVLIIANNIGEAVGVLCKLSYHNRFEILIIAPKNAIARRRIN